MFGWLYSFRHSCDCGDKVIAYLDNEKYEWVPKRFTAKQYALARRMYEDYRDRILKHSFVRDGDKAHLVLEMYKSIFLQKRLRTTRKKK